MFTVCLLTYMIISLMFTVLMIVYPKQETVTVKVLATFGWPLLLVYVLWKLIS